MNEETAAFVARLRRVACELRECADHLEESGGVGVGPWEWSERALAAAKAIREN